MIQKIVARRDAAEHLLHSLGSFTLGAGTARASAGKSGRIFGEGSHELWISRAISRFQQKAAVQQRSLKPAPREARRPTRLGLFVSARPIVLFHLAIFCHRQEWAAAAKRESLKCAVSDRRRRPDE